MRAIRTTWTITAAMLIVVGGARINCAAPPIDLEVAVESRAPITAQQQWLQRLSELKLGSVTLRAARPSESPEIVNRGSEQSPRYKIVALLTAKEKLVLKGGQFGAKDMPRLRQFLETLGTQGEAAATKPKDLFGLTSEQLIALTKNLETAVDEKTKGKPPAEVIQKIAARLAYPVRLSGAAQRALNDAAGCRDEVKGMTSGTALAVLLRPYGLVLQPAQAGRSVELVVVVPTSETEAWPAGWPHEGADREALPELMEFINVEIKDITLTDALAALEERLAAPFLFDHNQLAKHGVEPSKIEVTVPPGRSYYKRILERVLFQARLKSEIRTDELGKPIVWITTIKN